MTQLVILNAGAAATKNKRATSTNMQIKVKPQTGGQRIEDVQI